MAETFTADDDDWMNKAECRDADWNLFWVGNASSGPAYLEKVERAKEYCGRCVVRQECLDWADKTGDNGNIMGGMTPGERRAKQRKAAGKQPKP